MRNVPMNISVLVSFLPSVYVSPEDLLLFLSLFLLLQHSSEAKTSDNGQKAMKSDVDIHGPQRINPTLFGYPTALL